jgi:hypothetical protein
MSSGGSSSQGFGRIDEPGSGKSGEGLEGPQNLEAGVEAANAVPGAERAMTADWAAGGDDVNPPGFREGQGQPVNPVSGLPQMGDTAEAGAGSGRFGDLKEPGEVGKQGETARQTKKSTGMDPGNLASG